MPAITLDTSGGSYSPGYLYWAALGTAIPTNGGTSVASVFTDAWPAGWVSLGPTLEGSELNTDINTDTAQVAEFLDPLKVVTTSRTTTLSFSLYNTTLQNYKRVMNGGTISLTGGTAGTATAVNKFVPVQTGLEVRSMLGFESSQNDERVILYQCLQVGAVTERRRKGTDYNVFPAQFRCEVPASGISVERYTAGVTRLGT